MSLRNWMVGAGLLLLGACTSAEESFEEIFQKVSKHKNIK